MMMLGLLAHSKVSRTPSSFSLGLRIKEEREGCIVRAWFPVEVSEVWCLARRGNGGEGCYLERPAMAHVKSTKLSAYV